MIFAACDGAGQVELLLLPDDISGPAAKDTALTPVDALDVTGAYTAADMRPTGTPKPVGLLVRDGQVISREFVRFDGVLTVDRSGVPRLQMRTRVDLGGRRFNLNVPEERAGFLRMAEQAEADVLQSHLLIIDGQADVADQGGAPSFRRRILFQMANGDVGVFDSSPRALTLHDATEEVARRFSPAMALNLDMGSYNFCRRGAVPCGLLGADGLTKLSNLLRFRRRD